MAGDWKVRLDGHEWSLEDAGGFFAQGPHRIGRAADGHYYLTSPELTACATPEEASRVTERILGHVNSAAQVLDRSFVPVRVGALISIAPDGTERDHIVATIAMAAGAARVRGVALTIPLSGSVPSPRTSRSTAERLLDLLGQEPPESWVSRAMEQWNLPDRSPTALNNVLENIRNGIWGGDPAGKERQAWQKMAHTLAPSLSLPAQQFDDDLRRCRISLQDRASVGPLARHGSPRKVANAMDLDEARDFVHRLLRTWLLSKV